MTRLRSSLAAAAIFAGLTLLIFHSVLLTWSTDRVVSSSNSDLAYQFLPLRQFGFEELKHGHLAQWNPYIYGGEPYLAGFQSALFYPPNVLHLLLPLKSATNWISAMHIFFAGYAMYLWARGRGASFWAGILAGTMFMFCGPLFLRIYAGHVTHLLVMPWPPLLMLTIDRLSATGRWAWCLVGIAGVTLALLGGSPQYVYYMGLISVVYVMLLLKASQYRRTLVTGVVTTFVVAVLISAVQLLPSLQNSRETVRSGGTDYEFASSLPLPPENLLTFLAPGIFGNLRADSRPPAIDYFGRNFLWESSLFVGISGLTLALLAAAGQWKRNWPIAMVAVVTIVLALGRNVPIYRLLYDWLPMYGSFRAVSKFGFFTAMFLCPLAADGFDLLRAGGRRRLVFGAAGVFAVAAIFLGVFAVELRMSAGSPRSDWAGVLRSSADSPEGNIPRSFLSRPDFILATASNAANAVTVATVVLATAAVLIASAGLWPRVAYGLVVLAVVEMLTFARSSFATTAADDVYPPAWVSAARQMNGDFRVVNVGFSVKELGRLDQDMVLHIQNTWGYDPGVLKRYAETLTASQNGKATEASQYLPIYSVHNAIFQMLRTRLQLNDFGTSQTAVELPGAMSVAQLIPGYTVEPVRDDVLARITSPDFDPRKMVVLESPPGIVPAADGTAGPAEAVSLSTDVLKIHAVVQRPTLLLVTNNYSTGWHASAAGPTAPQKSYDIQPANRTLMAIPLAAGVHDIRLEFLPTSYRIGRIVSGLSVLGYLGWCVSSFKKRSRPSAAKIDSHNG